jgi:hypothetical protein
LISCHHLYRLEIVCAIKYISVFCKFYYIFIEELTNDARPLLSITVKHSKATFELIESGRLSCAERRCASMRSLLMGRGVEKGCGGCGGMGGGSGEVDWRYCCDAVCVTFVPVCDSR